MVTRWTLADEVQFYNLCDSDRWQRSAVKSFQIDCFHRLVEYLGAKQGRIFSLCYVCPIDR